MIIELNEISKFKNYMGNNFNKFVCGLEETDDYEDNILNSIVIDAKTIISEYLRNAIECGFDEEIMENDFDIPKEFIELLLRYRYEKIEADINY